MQMTCGAELRFLIRRRIQIHNAVQIDRMCPVPHDEISPHYIEFLSVLAAVGASRRAAAAPVRYFGRGWFECPRFVNSPGPTLDCPA
jgi:hypothetical protein